MKTILQLTDALAHRFTFVALSAALCLGARAAALEPFELKDGDRVLFIGDTFFEREVEYGHIETRLTAAFPDRNITFRNLAWAADTPMGRSREFRLEQAGRRMAQAREGAGRAREA